MRGIKYLVLIVIFLLGAVSAYSGQVKEMPTDTPQDKTSIHIASNESKFVSQVLPGVWSLFNLLESDTPRQSTLNKVPIIRALPSHSIITSRTGTNVFSPITGEYHCHVPVIRVSNMQMARYPDERITPYYFQSIVLRI